MTNKIIMKNYVTFCRPMITHVCHFVLKKSLVYCRYYIFSFKIPVVRLTFRRQRTALPEVEEFLVISLAISFTGGIVTGLTSNKRSLQFSEMAPTNNMCQQSEVRYDQRNIVHDSAMVYYDHCF